MTKKPRRKEISKTPSGSSTAEMTDGNEAVSDTMNDTEEPQIIEPNLADALETERARAAEYLDQAQRTRAEMINYRVAWSKRCRLRDASRPSI